MKGARPGPLPAEEARLARMLERPFAPPDPVTRVDLTIALGLFAAALFFRCLAIGWPSLWVDEGASLAFIRAGWVELWTTIPLVETNPPGYYALLKAWTALAGSADAVLRLPGAIAGALAVLCLYLVALRAYGRGAAIVAATMLALSAPQVAYAQEARAFAFVSLLVVLGIGLINRLARLLSAGQRSWPEVIGVALVTAALPYLHYSGYFVAIVLLVYALALLAMRGLLRRATPRLILALLLAGLFALPPLSWTLYHLGSGENPAGWLGPPSLAEAKWVFHQTFGHAYLPFGRPGWLPETVPDHKLVNLLATRRLAELSLFLVCAWGLWASLRQKDRTVPALAIALLALVVLFVGVSQVKPVLLERTVIFGIPLLALLAGYAVMSLRFSYLVVPAAVLVMGFQAANLTAYYPNAEKEPWRHLIADLRDGHRPGDAVVLVSGPYLPASITLAPLLAHYWREAPKGMVFALPSTATKRIFETGLGLMPELVPLESAEICTRLAGVERLVLLYRDRAHLDAVNPDFETLGSTATGEVRRGLLGFQYRSGVTCPAATGAD